MENKILVPPIKTAEDIRQLRYKHEQDVARFLLGVNPNLDIYYEAVEYALSEEEAAAIKQRKTSTVPDFEIVNPDTETAFVLEVTRKNTGKHAQRRIVEAAGQVFVALHRQEVMAISEWRDEGTTVFERCQTPSMRQLRQMIMPPHSAGD